MADNALVFRFLAELLKKTMDIDSDTAFQAAVQAFANDLLPWLSPRDLAGPPRPEFSMLGLQALLPENLR